MTLRFFIDDSGKNDPPVFVLGGWTIEVGKVAEFEADWRSVLDQAPAIPYFKMKEANARRGAFEGFSVPERDRKLVALSEIMRAHAVATISATTRHDDYERVYHKKMMRSMDEPYQMMFHLVIATAYKLRNELGRPEGAEFVFDRQLDQERSIREIFAAMKNQLPPELEAFLASPPRHADDKEEIGLQAADLVAWHVRRSWREGRTGLRSASAAGPALVQIHGKHDLFNEQTLQWLAGIATRSVRRLNTVFPYEAEKFAENFDVMATLVNFEVMQQAVPFRPTELISFPATGTARYRLVRNCALVGTPHLHRRSDSSCLAATSAD